MRFFSRLTILARGITRRPRSRCRRSSSSTSSRDVSRFPPITRSLARPQFRFLPRRCTVHILSLFLLFFSASQFRFPYRCFYFRHAFRRYRAIRTHSPPTHPPQPPKCRRGCTRVTELESKSRAIRFDGTVDRSIARSTERTTPESIEQEAANLLVRLQPQSAESAGAANASHPYRMPQMLQEKFADDFPLRKTGTYARPCANTRCYTINSRVVE